MFLTELYSKTQDPIILHTLNGALNTIYFNLEDDKVNNFGYYSGKIGVGYTLWKIGKKLGNDEIANKGLAYVKSVKDKEITDYEVDIISGAAGSISVLLKLYYAEQDDEFLEIAKKCGQFLLGRTIKNEDTCARRNNFFFAKRVCFFRSITNDFLLKIFEPTTFQNLSFLSKILYLLGNT